MFMYYVVAPLAKSFLVLHTRNFLYALWFSHAAGFLSENMEFPGQMWAFLSDGIGIISGSMMGTTSLTVYIESAAGIEDGGRTGLTGVFCGCVVSEWSVDEVAC